MKRVSIVGLVLLLLLTTWSCDKSAKGDQDSPDAESTVSSEGTNEQIILGQIIGPELRKAVDFYFGGPHNNVRGVGLVCKRDKMYIFAVDFNPDKSDKASPVVYVIASVLIGKDGKPFWRLQEFAIDFEEFLTKYGKLNGNQMKVDKESDQ